MNNTIRPAMLHVIDAKGVRWEWPEPMREAPGYLEVFYQVDYFRGRAVHDKWEGVSTDRMALDAGLCQATEEGAQQQLAALRAVCRGGDV